MSSQTKAEMGGVAGTKTSGENAPLEPAPPRKAAGAKDLRGLYYAVRVGYAVGRPSAVLDDEGDGDDDENKDDDDSVDNESGSGSGSGSRRSKKRKLDEEPSRVDREPPGPAPIVKIRSAVFLYWEDAAQFIESVDDDPSREAEYAVFDSFREAEAYLLAGDRELAMNAANATASEGVVDAVDRFIERRMGGNAPEAIEPVAVEGMDKHGNGAGREGGMAGAPGAANENESESEILTKSKSVEKKNGSSVDGVEIADTETANPSLPSWGDVPFNAAQAALLNILIADGGGFGPIPPSGLPNPVVGSLRGSVRGAIGGIDNLNQLLGLLADAPATAQQLRVPSLPEIALLPNQSEDPDAHEHDRNDDGLATTALSLEQKRERRRSRDARRREKQWNEMYQRLEVYRAAHGCIDIPEIPDDEKDDPVKKGWAELRRWCSAQANSLGRHYRGEDAGKLMTPDKVEKLESIGLLPSLDERVTKKRLRDSLHKERRWDDMYEKLEEYKALRGTIDIPDVPDDAKDDPEQKDLVVLRKWCSIQANNLRRCSRGKEEDTLTDEQRKKLEDIGFHMAPSWEQLYERLLSHKSEAGTLEVDKEDDEDLFTWIKDQKRMLARHFEGKPVWISDDRLQKLMSLGYKKGEDSGVVDTVSEEAKWNAMLNAAEKYKEEKGTFAMSTSTKSMTKEERLLKYWMTKQRKDYKNSQEGKESSLTVQRLQRLNEIGLDLAPVSEFQSWDERMESLRQFKAEHGHLKPKRGHPLTPFVSNVRHFYSLREQGKQTCLTDERVNDLVEIGFVFKAGKSPNVTAKGTLRRTWEERFQELQEYKAEHGHTLVPQLTGPLGVWVKEQRTGYRRMKAGQKTFMTAEKALMLKEIGFHFDAARFKGRNRQVE